MCNLAFVAFLNFLIISEGQTLVSYAKKLILALPGHTLISYRHVSFTKVQD